MRDEQFKKIEEKVAEFDSLFLPGFIFSIKRLLCHPYKTLIRKFQTKTSNKFYFLTKANTFFGYPMYIHTFEYTVWFSGFLGGAEILLQKYLIKCLRDDEIFFDIGSHHGFYSLLAHKISKRVQIHAFEPTQTHYNVLKKNIALYPNIIANEIALTEHKGEITFYENIKGKSTIEKDFFKNTSSANDFHAIKVQSTTLDCYCNEKKIFPTFIKLDVEGSELSVLKGSLETLKKASPVIAIELWSKPYDNSNHIKAVNLLHENGYIPYSLNEQGEITQMSYEELNTILLKKNASNNYIFKKGK